MKGEITILNITLKTILSRAINHRFSPRNQTTLLFIPMYKIYLKKKKVKRFLKKTKLKLIKNNSKFWSIKVMSKGFFKKNERSGNYY